jgi:hypothetical protein
MAGLSQLFGAVSQSGLGTAVRAGVQAGRTAQQVRGAYQGYEDGKRLIETALNEDDYLRNGTTKDYIKKLNEDVVKFTSNIPVIGEPLSILSTPLIEGYNAFVDDVLAPIFFDTEAEEKALERRRDWVQFTAERSLAKYGYVMTPQEWSNAEFEQLKENVERKNKQLSEEMEAFQKKAEEEGFKTVEEYRVASREANKKEIEEDVKALGYNSPREYLDATREETKRIRQERRSQGRGVIPRGRPGEIFPQAQPITYNNPRTSPFVSPIRPSIVPARPTGNIINPFSTLIQAQQNALAGIIQGITPIQYSGVRPS